jgi:DNA mismatch endonuclease (patch repair protein)
MDLGEANVATGIPPACCVDCEQAMKRGLDRLTKERRSWNMSRIRGKDTNPELIVRRLLHKMGYRFRLHVRIPIPEELQTTKLKDGTSKRIRAVSVDIVLPKYKTAIFVHGCFWHRHDGCKNCTTPTRRRDWWLTKLEGNALRDQMHLKALQNLNWHTIVIWECKTGNPDHITKLLKDLAEIPH